MPAMQGLFPRLLRPLAAVLVCLMALSAQAWASHIDWPLANGGQGHAAAAALDGAEIAGSAHADHTEHCCHAGAHLIGLHGRHAHLASTVPATHIDAPQSRYRSITHPPLIDPPIA